MNLIPKVNKLQMLNNFFKFIFSQLNYVWIFLLTELFPQIHFLKTLWCWSYFNFAVCSRTISFVIETKGFLQLEEHTKHLSCSFKQGSCVISMSVQLEDIWENISASTGGPWMLMGDWTLYPALWLHVLMWALWLSIESCLHFFKNPI